MADIIIDFDGTIAVDEYPNIGVEVPGAAACITALYHGGHKLALWTAREGEYLIAALRWLAHHNILNLFTSINDNLPHRVERYGNNCRKVVGDVTIDDRALGCPLLVWKGKLCVDWHEVMVWINKWEKEHVE